MVDPGQFRAAVEDELTRDILPWWSERMLDPAGGFFGRITGEGVLEAGAPRGAVMHARILWTFSAAYRLLGRPEYLATATHAKRYLIDRFYDREFGGVYWSLRADGTPLDTKKQFYALGFAVYGLGEYAWATGDGEALEYAVKLFESIEEHSFDPERGGYIEACTRRWGEIADPRLSDKDAAERKTMNTHLHILEPYTDLHRVWPDERLARRLRGLVELFLERMEQPSHHLGLFFDDDWRLKGGGISYGHDIEASWLLLEAALELGDDALTETVLRHAKDIGLAALEGVNPDGSMNYHLHEDGRLDTERHWWVQAEALVGQMWLWRYHGMAEGLEGAQRTWKYIRENLLDPAGGEWWWSADAEGAVNRADDKAGLWKCPYHNGRMCMEVMEIIGHCRI
jgi:mannobiose 2-epimerase